LRSHSHINADPSERKKLMGNGEKEAAAHKLLIIIT
jgi:hypothetical protein